MRNAASCASPRTHERPSQVTLQFINELHLLDGRRAHEGVAPMAATITTLVSRTP